MVTVIIVTWNGAHLLPPCLGSLRNQTMPREHFRIVVVDNASSDNTVRLLSRDYPEVRLVKTEENQGFAGGANIALRGTTTPYAVVLNNDTIAEPGLLHALVRCLEDPSNRRVGAVTGKVLLAENGLVNSTGNLMSRTGRGFDRDWQMTDGTSRQAGEVFGFCGAAAALRMEAVREVGLFDEELFLYYEDTDLSWRLRAAGWSVVYEPGAVAHHCHASSSNVGSPRFHLWNERNSMVVFTRHAPAPLVGGMLARRAIGLLVHTARDGFTDVTRARWQAAGEYLRRLPLTLRERRRFWHAASRSRAEVAAMLTARPGD